jgi:hypothetical protein
LREFVPRRVGARVEVDDVVIEQPTLVALAPGCDQHFDAVVLHVRRSGEQRGALRHLLRIVLLSPLTFKPSGSAKLEMPPRYGQTEPRVVERLLFFRVAFGIRPRFRHSRIDDQGEYSSLIQKPMLVRGAAASRRGSI